MCLIGWEVTEGAAYKWHIEPLAVERNYQRVLCNLLGNDVEAGLVAGDLDLLGKMVEDICFNNAKNYFPMELD